MTSASRTSLRRRFVGTAVSNAKNKTLTVRVERTLMHPKYGKQYVRSSRYHVHDEDNRHKTGDLVSFEECRPYSRTKRWRVIENPSF